jgi:hypothetical protein
MTQPLCGNSIMCIVRGTGDDAGHNVASSSQVLSTLIRSCCKISAVVGTNIKTVFRERKRAINDLSKLA